MNEIVTIIKDEKYTALLLDICSAVVEYRKRRAYDTILADHYIGRAITDFVQQNGVEATTLVKEIALDLNKSERSVWNSYILWKDHPDVDKVIDEVARQFDKPNPNLTMIRAKYLGDGSKDKEFDPKREATILIKKYGAEKAVQVAQAIVETVFEKGQKNQNEETL